MDRRMLLTGALAGLGLSVSPALASVGMENKSDVPDWVVQYLKAKGDKDGIVNVVYSDDGKRRHVTYAPPAVVASPYWDEIRITLYECAKTRVEDRGQWYTSNSNMGRFFLYPLDEGLHIASINEGGWSIQTRDRDGNRLGLFGHSYSQRDPVE